MAAPSGATLSPELLDGLLSEDSAKRDGALGRIAAMPPNEVDALAEWLSQLDDAPADALASRLVRHGSRSQAVVAKIGARMRSATRHALGFAETLETVGPRAVPVLADVTRNGTAEARTWATRAIGRFREQAAAAVPALTDRLADESVDVRLEAVRALERVGGGAASALPKLIAAGKQPGRFDGSDRSDLLTAIGRIATVANRPSEAIEFLIAEVSSTAHGWMARAAAAGALGHLRTAAPQSLPILRREFEKAYLLSQNAPSDDDNLLLPLATALLQLGAEDSGPEQYLELAASEGMGRGIALDAGERLVEGRNRSRLLALRILTPLINEGSASQRVRAIQASARALALDKGETARALEQASTSQDEEVRTAARQALDSLKK